MFALGGGNAVWLPEKGRGFRFEDTRITDPPQFQKLVAVIAIAFAWAHRVSEWRH